MGFHYGQLLFEKGVNFNDFINLTEEQYQFGLLSLDLLKQVYPEIVDEMQGMAAAQQIDFKRFSANLLTAGVFNKDYGCSCFCMKKDDQLIFAKNHDMFSSLKKVTESAVYRPEKGNIFLAQGDAIIGKEDGVNEHGLAVGATFIASAKVKPGINFLFLVRYLLEKCATVQECIQVLNQVPISSSQNFILMDKSGDMAVVESCSTMNTVRRPESGTSFILATNNFISPEMQPWDNCPDRNWFHSQDRYNAIYQSLKGQETRYTPLYAMEILSGKHGFVCQYEKSLGFDTLYSFVTELQSGRIYRTEGNPAKTPFREDDRLAWAIDKKKAN